MRGKSQNFFSCVLVLSFSSISWVYGKCVKGYGVFEKCGEREREMCRHAPTCSSISSGDRSWVDFSNGRSCSLLFVLISSCSFFLSGLQIFCLPIFWFPSLFQDLLIFLHYHHYFIIYTSLTLFFEQHLTFSFLSLSSFRSLLSPLSSSPSTKNTHFFGRSSLTNYMHYYPSYVTHTSIFFFF